MLGFTALRDRVEYWLARHFCDQLLDFTCQLTHRAADAGLSCTSRRVMAMNRAEFEAELWREGYELQAGTIEPNVHRDAHAHDFDARLLVLEGSVTLVFGSDRCIYRPGDSCNVPAGTMHEEHTEADGVRFLAGRRPGAKTATAE